jgi:hypothetical protein
MNYITSQDGGDGFGSQLLSRISGIAYANYHDLTYVNFPIRTIILEDNPSTSRNNELDNVNLLLENIMKNLRIKSINEIDPSEKIDIYDRLSFYHEINLNLNQYFTIDFLGKLKNSYNLRPPDYYSNEKLNIAIHVRRGNDIRSDDFSRYVTSDIYVNIIERILKKYDNAIIHIFSWNDPELKIESDRIEYHITYDGGKEFLSDFNALVHADILLIGSSTFSLSAGFFNKNMVLYNKDIHRMQSINPFVPDWENNFHTIIGNLDQ